MVSEDGERFPERLKQKNGCLTMHKMRTVHQFIINRFSPKNAVTSKLAVGVLLVTKPNHFFRQTLAQISRPPNILQFSIFSTAQSPHTNWFLKPLSPAVIGQTIKIAKTLWKQCAADFARSYFIMFIAASAVGCWQWVQV